MAATVTIARVDDLQIAYRDTGSGPAVLLLHGWPTSSHLWEGVTPAIAATNRVIAPDLPGFGASSKPRAAYDYAFFARAIEGLLDELGVERVALGVHDLGGPIGLLWALRNPERVTALAVLNTLAYPEFSPAVVQFVTALTTPAQREFLTSPGGLDAALRLGIADHARITPELQAAVSAPFTTEADRRALAAAGIGFEIAGFEEIARDLHTLSVPVRIVYGERDEILPDIAQTVARMRDDLPQAEVVALPAAGHFLQYDAPDQVAALLAEFFAGAATTGR